MRLQNQIAIILLCWAVAFFYIRWLLSGIISYQLNNSAYKKRKKGMRFKEWFLYSRYREEIPKILLLLYFVIVFGHPLMTLVCLFLYLVGPYPEIGRVLVTGVMIFDFGWQVIYVLAFWTRDSKPDYSRWIKKKRGIPPKRRK